MIQIIYKATQLLLGLAIATATNTVLAASAVQSNTRAESSSQFADWQFSGSAYFWAAQLTGDVQQFNGPTVKADTPFSDILSDLDFASMMVLEARKGRYSVFLDVAYTKISSGADLPFGLVAEKASLATKNSTVTLGAGYTMYQAAQWQIDAVLALRYWRAQSRLDFDGGALNAVHSKDGEDWFNALLGVKARYAITDNSYLSTWALAGAGDADIDWEAALLYGYQFSDSLAIVAGYRGNGVDYQKRKFSYDVIQHGPVLGVRWFF